MTDWHPDPPVYAACMRESGDRLEAVRALLAQGADPNATDHRGYPPLSSSKVWSSPALMDLLLEHGADPDVMSRGNHLLGELVRSYPFHRTPEERQALKTAVERILKAGADPNLRAGAIDASPLWLAIKWEWADLIPALLQAGADPKLTDDTGQDALEWAIQCEDLGAVEALAGLEGVKAAAARDIDAECAAIFHDIVLRLQTGRFKLRFTTPGYRYEYEVFHEFYWHKWQWMEARYSERGHKNPSHSELTYLGLDEDVLQARVASIEQLHLTIHKPRTRAWRQLRKRHLQPRDRGDLLVRALAAQKE